MPYKAGETTILRLNYMRNGVVYNVGVVDNISDGSDRPIGPDGGLDIPPWVWWLLAGVLVLVVFVLIATLLPDGINIVISILTAIGKGIYFILSLPVRFIRWIAERRGGDK